MRNIRMSTAPPKLTEKTSLRFGVYAEMQCPPEKPHTQLYREIQR